MILQRVVIDNRGQVYKCLRKNQCTLKHLRQLRGFVRILFPEEDERTVSDIIYFKSTKPVNVIK